MIKQFIPPEVCLKCQGCCRFSQKESIWLPRLLNKEKKKLEKKVCLKFNPEGDNFICAGFDLDKNRCKIYRLRPFECRLYPFLLNHKEQKIFLAIDLKCPFTPDKLASHGFKTYVQYLAGLLDSPNYTEILKNNPQLSQEYPEVLNLRELKFNR